MPWIKKKSDSCILTLATMGKKANYKLYLNTFLELDDKEFLIFKSYGSRVQKSSFRYYWQPYKLDKTEAAPCTSKEPDHHCNHKFSNLFKNRCGLNRKTLFGAKNTSNTAEVVLWQGSWWRKSFTAYKSGYSVRLFLLGGTHIRESSSTFTLLAGHSVG